MAHNGPMSTQKENEMNIRQLLIDTAALIVTVGGMWVLFIAAAVVFGAGL